MLEKLYWINRNMRCIEIAQRYNRSLPAPAINRNMRCIEILKMSELEVRKILINRNMRCIEIEYCSPNHLEWRLRLIET